MPEIELHKQVVFPLLRAKMARNVQYVHGSFEKGKDILYNCFGFHGQSRLEVWQVKNQPFSGRAGDKNHVAEVLTQLSKQCRYTEIRNPETGRSERPRGVVLYSTYDLPDKDTLGLGRFFQELDELECDFIGPDKLIDQLKEHLRDLHADYAFPGGGLFRVIRRYVDVHHEALAFDLRSNQRKALKDCFVNLGVGQAGQTLDRLARGELLTTAQ